MATRHAWRQTRLLAPSPTGAPVPTVQRYLSRRVLQLILGGLWLFDGLLQLFPSMWTQSFVDDVMRPALDSQPGLVAFAIQPFVDFSATHLVLVNTGIAAVQLLLG